jgi:hypothetical protein
VADIVSPAQEATVGGRKKRNPCVQMGVTACPDTRPRRPYGESCRARWRRRLDPIEALQRTALWSRAGDPKSAQTAIEIANGGSSALLGQRRQRIRRYHAGGNALSGVGRGAASAIRAQAVDATMIAPATAIACRQSSAGTPSARGRVRHDIQRQQLVARRGMRSPRVRGDRSVVKPICPATRVMLPAIAPTMIAAIDPELP